MHAIRKLKKYGQVPTDIIAPPDRAVVRAAHPAADTGPWNRYGSTGDVGEMVDTFPYCVRFGGIEVPAFRPATMLHIFQGPERIESLFRCGGRSSVIDETKFELVARIDL